VKKPLPLHDGEIIAYLDILFLTKKPIRSFRGFVVLLGFHSDRATAEQLEAI
jgi:hypothetical protein